MALVVNLKCIENLRGKADRVVKVRFRGVVHQSKVAQNAKRVAYFGQSFEWPIARSVGAEEQVDIQVLNYNKYLSNKVVGSYIFLLQQLIEDGEIKISDNLVDSNNRILESTITFDVNYYSPDGKVGQWGKEEFTYPLVDTYRDDENVDGMSTDSGHLIPASLLQTQTLREIQDEQNADFLDDARSFTGSLTGEDTTSQQVMLESMFKSQKELSLPELFEKRPDMLAMELHKPRDFQICVRIVEGQQIAGLDIDPVIRIDVGTDHKYTNIKRSTNCPYYDEYFVFDYRESPATIFDKMITLTAFHAYAIPGREVFKAGNVIAGKRKIGVFKCDVGTVYTAPNHHFFHKWAVLLDPKDISEGPKGYIKCDLAVIGKGDVMKVPKGIKDSETNNIEGNLLLPAGLRMQRQRAIYSVTLFRAEDLPRSDLGIMASVRKAMNMAAVALVDAFVKVSFAGHTGKTSVKKSYNPEWKEILNFIDMFPPLCNRMKIQLCDDNAVKDDNIGTHFIELPQIMDPGGDADGILPTFGPAWINFYGAPRDYKVFQQHDDLNEGLGEGSAYRGRLLISLSTKLIEDDMGGPSTVVREKLLRTGGWMDNQPRKEFLIFGVIYDFNMIDKDLKDKLVYLEVSIAHYGNTLDAKATTKPKVPESDSSGGEEEDDALLDDHTSNQVKKRKEEETRLQHRSTTEPQIPLTKDNEYGYMPYDEKKPCLYVRCLFEDVRNRLYNSTLVEKTLSVLEEGLEEVKQMIDMEHEYAHRRLRGVLEQFESRCDKYMKIANSPMVRSQGGLGRTDLDKFRFKSCKNKIDKMKSTAASCRKTVTADTVKEKYREMKQIVRRMKFISKDPQHALPDVFIWMVCDNKRIAFHRLPAKDLIHSNTDDIAGKFCGKRQTIFLRKPGKLGVGQSGWAVQAKVDLSLWLGERDVRKKESNYLETLPTGYEIVPDSMPSVPPLALVYAKKNVFQLRAYIYQARSLIGSDDSGLSDPFARVIMGNQCKTTQIVDETLSPTWDETLVCEEVVIYGELEDILQNPPVVMVEIYDSDMVGKPEFLGRSIIKPKVKPEAVAYIAPDWPPQLEWYDVYRGPRQAGELLASFELIQGDEKDLPLPPPPSQMSKDKGPIVPLPLEIKPTLSKYRIEVLFWGIRECKRIQLLKVEKPRAAAECSGVTLTSRTIEDIDKCSNFDRPVQYMDVDLPDNEMYWPPLTIRVVDCRKFGRSVMVGSCTISNLSKYVWVPPEERERRAEEQRQKRLDMLAKLQSKSAHDTTASLQLGNGSLLDDSRKDSITASMHGTEQGPPQDVLHGSIHGSDHVDGSNLRSVHGSIHGSAPGSIHGSIRGSTHGTVPGSIHGSIRGSTHGTVPLSIQGSTHGSIRGTIPRSIDGSVHGSTQGSIIGSTRDSVHINVDDRASLLRQTTSTPVAPHHVAVAIDGTVPNVDVIQPYSNSVQGDGQSRVQFMDHVSHTGVGNGTLVPGQQPQSILKHSGLPSGAGNGPGSLPHMQTHTLIAGDAPPGSELPPVVGVGGGTPHPMPLPPPPKPPAKEKKKLVRKKELIAELDWWSKYYVTKEDMEKEYHKEQKRMKDMGMDYVKEADSNSDDQKGDTGYEMDVIDYGELDDAKFTEVRELSKQGREEEEKDKRTKGKKEKKKKKPRKSAKERLAQLKGAVNIGFNKDDEDENIDDVMGLEDIEEMEDKSHIQRIEVYQTELENVPEFGGFHERMQTFELFKGKQLDDDDDSHLRVSAKIKGTLCIYKIGDTNDDTMSEMSIISMKSSKKKDSEKAPGTPKLKLMDGLPNPKPFEVKVVVYIVKATDLHPMDSNGKADPYVIVTCGRNQINDKDNKQSNQLNPVFGRVMEFDVVFPMDSMLKIQVMDYDMLSADDLIGETSMDLENRFFSKHGARCTLQQEYEEWGYNVWRDPMKPTQILERICKENKLDPPRYKTDQNSVYVGGSTFYAEAEIESETGGAVPTNEPLALEALRHWEDVRGGCAMVAEHIETRSLQNPDQPGVEQGKLELWVDMFPKDQPLPSIQVDITPRQPKGFELRCIVWNTDEVVLEDTNILTGEASSDIFVKGYIKGPGVDGQQTDVHYRSLTGEGNFNWRFCYPFEYLKAEEKIVYKASAGAFDMSDTEVKVPAKLTLQVWDADIVSADDFLGYMALDIHRIPRPAKDPKRCTDKMLRKIEERDGSIPVLNLFKNKRCKGWWPMVAKDKEGGIKLVGKIEAELQLLSADEAERSPAGHGREDPDSLPEPNRPDSSFLWFMNPLKTLRYILWKNWKWKILKFFLFLLVAVFIGLAIYAIPGTTVDKMFGN